LPVPVSDIDAYVVYIGFDSMSAPPKRPPPRAKRAGKAKS
jgi:hypothetical protein